MKPALHTLAIFALFIIVTACNNLSAKKEGSVPPSELNVININNEYTVSLPKYMNEAKSLNENASLQYQNIYKETYVIVIDENKQNFIDTFVDLGEYDSLKSVVENYSDVQIKSLQENMDIKSKSNPEGFMIGKLDAQQVQMDANVEGVKDDISYFLTFIEGKDKVYMMMSWTLKERKDKYTKTFEDIAKSFTLL